MQQDKGDVSPLVVVLACGYHQVHIAKSGLSFPAWLVHVAVSAPAASSKQKEAPSATTCCCVWRSKRDFWRLARRTNHIRALPKSAWTKLDEEAPWKRPDLDIYLTTTSHVGRVKRDDEDNNDPQTRLFETNAADKNNWQPFMRKSLHQIDQFLQLVAAEAQRSDPVREAWNEFVKGISSDENAQNSTVRVGNALGQYFCDPLNARQLVRTALLRLQTIFGDDPLSLAFVEPSCGHGQIIESLLEAVRSPDCPIVIENFQVRAIDLDSLALEKCRGNFCQEPSVDCICANFLLTSQDPSKSRKSTVVVVGGPPYTAGAGQGGSSSDESSLCRDLPMRFVRQAIDAYAAQVVCFLMPVRCQKIDYVKENWIPENYKYESIPLEAPSVFFFQGTNEPVTQPSTIQCFWRRCA